MYRLHLQGQRLRQAIKEQESSGKESLRKEAIGYSEKAVHVYRTTRRHIQVTAVGTLDRT
jgi:hypothetical protein